ncbi:hypothetical protein DMENIID0001_044510 [Sergentomyia squamirostris]
MGGENTCRKSGGVDSTRKQLTAEERKELARDWCLSNAKRVELNSTAEQQKQPKSKRLTPEEYRRRQLAAEKAKAVIREQEEKKSVWTIPRKASDETVASSDQPVISSSPLQDLEQLDTTPKNTHQKRRDPETSKLTLGQKDSALVSSPASPQRKAAPGAAHNTVAGSSRAFNPTLLALDRNLAPKITGKSRFLPKSQAYEPFLGEGGVQQRGVARAPNTFNVTPTITVPLKEFAQLLGVGVRAPELGRVHGRKRGGKKVRERRLKAVIRKLRKQFTSSTAQ